MQEPTIRVERNEPERLLHIRRDGTEVLVVDYDQARQLLGELAAELLEVEPDRPIGRALGDLLEAMSDALTARQDGER